jgi:hypothetical protein
MRRVASATLPSASWNFHIEENTMKKIVISLIALAALAAPALAERNWDISSPPVGETIFGQKKMKSAADTNLFAVPAGVHVRKTLIDDGHNDNNAKNSAR